MGPSAVWHRTHTFGRHASPFAAICEAAASYRRGELTPPCFVSLWAGAQNAGIFARRIRFFCPASVLAHGKKRVSLSPAPSHRRQGLVFARCGPGEPSGLTPARKLSQRACLKSLRTQRMRTFGCLRVRFFLSSVPPPSFTPSGRRFAISAVRPFSCAFAVSSPKNDTSAPRNFFAIMIQYP